MSDDPIKDALKMIPYGFYSITSRNGDTRNVMVANWLMQTSFEPRQVALGLAKKAYSHGLITDGEAFVVNIFKKADAETIKPFSKSHAKNPDKFNDVHYSDGPETGVPVLDEAAAYLECKVVGRLDAGGDHEIIVGEVVGAGVRKAGEPTDTLTLPDLGWSYAG